MNRLSYKDVLEILGYRPAKRHVLEILGYENSKEGRQKFQTDHVDLEVMLSSAISKDVNLLGIFPRKFLLQKPEVGTYLKKSGQAFVVVEMDKPSVWTQWSYSSLESAARALIRKLCDSAYLVKRTEAEGYVSVQSSSDG
jgi:hypothetical protein